MSGVIMALYEYVAFWSFCYVLGYFGSTPVFWLINKWRQRRRTIICVRDELETGPIGFPTEFAKRVREMHDTREG